MRPEIPARKASNACCFSFGTETRKEREFCAFRQAVKASANSRSLLLGLSEADAP